MALSHRAFFLIYSIHSPTLALRKVTASFAFLLAHEFLLGPLPQVKPSFPPLPQIPDPRGLQAQLLYSTLAPPGDPHCKKTHMHLTSTQALSS